MGLRDVVEAAAGRFHMVSVALRCGAYAVGMRSMTAGLTIAASLLLLTGCMSEATEPFESRTPSEASSPIKSSISTPALDEAAVVSECSAAIQARDFSEGGAPFAEVYPTNLALTSVQDGEWFVVFRPAIATGQTNYYCVSDGDAVVSMNRDEYTESVT